jgi:hypothetical protein
MHEQGIVHSDVKTWNFCKPLYNHEGQIYTYGSKLSRIYVVDMGFAYDLKVKLGKLLDTGCALCVRGIKQSAEMKMLKDESMVALFSRLQERQISFAPCLV